MNLLAKLIDGKDVEEAMVQLMFCKKRHANQVLWAIHTGTRIARDIQKMNPKKMYVGELHFWKWCFVKYSR